MVLSLVFGVPFVLAGWLAYSGRWRSWTARYIFRPYPFFGALFLGLAVWLAVPTIGLADHGHDVLTLVTGLPLVACWLIFMLSIVWLPAWLTPGWFRAWKLRGMHRSDYAKPTPSRGLIGRRRG